MTSCGSIRPGRWRLRSCRARLNDTSHWSLPRRRPWAMRRPGSRRGWRRVRTSMRRWRRRREGADVNAGRDRVGGRSSQSRCPTGTPQERPPATPGEKDAGEPSGGTIGYRTGLLADDCGPFCIHLIVKRGLLLSPDFPYLNAIVLCHRDSCHRNSRAMMDLPERGKKAWRGGTRKRQ